MCGRARVGRIAIGTAPVSADKLVVFGLYLFTFLVGTGFALGLWPRSPLFMLLVLAHGFRRLLPPY